MYIKLIKSNQQSSVTKHILFRILLPVFAEEFSIHIQCNHYVKVFLNGHLSMYACVLYM
jgi:hypothetical protein